MVREGDKYFMKDFEALGFQTPQVIEHKNGIKVYIPENKNSDNWCVHIPPNLLNINNSSNNWYDQAFKNGFNYYCISRDEAISIVWRYSSSVEKEQCKAEIEKEKEAVRAVEQFKRRRRAYSKPKHKHYDKILELKQQGLSYKEISSQLECSYQTVYNIINSLKQFDKIT